MVAGAGPILPIKMDETSNGEFPPLALPAPLRAAQAVAADRLVAHARALGQSRRGFLGSLCGAATTLLAFNQAHAALGNIGGRFAVRPDAAFEPAAAEQDLAPNGELIFDIQTHLVDPNGTWRSNAGRGFERILAWWPQGSFGLPDPTECYDADHFIKEVFLDSDTDLG